MMSQQIAPQTVSPIGIGLDGIGVVPRIALLVDLFLTSAKFTRLAAAPHPWTKAVGLHIGYIAGTGDGLLTVGGKVAIREILLADADNIHQGFSHRATSLANGHYLLDNLDPAKRYLILARDHEGGYEPCCYDYIKPASDLSVEQLAELWEQMLDA